MVQVQYRDLGSKEVKIKSSWFTVEGNIEPPIRSYEVAGLAENHNYRQGNYPHSVVFIRIILTYLLYIWFYSEQVAVIIPWHPL